MAVGSARFTSEGQIDALDGAGRLGPSLAPFPNTRDLEFMAEAKAKATDIATGTAEVNAGHLRAFVERIERLEEEKKALADDIKDVYGEAKANGFDNKDHAQDRLDPEAGP